MAGEHEGEAVCTSPSHTTQLNYVPRRPSKGPKTVSFASTVKFTERTGRHSPVRRDDAQMDFSEPFLLLLLLTLALLAPAGQAIAHVNDIIILYVGYSAISWVCRSPCSPFASLLSGTTSFRRTYRAKPALI